VQEAILVLAALAMVTQPIQRVVAVAVAADILEP
jgi:hypothetical protein